METSADGSPAEPGDLIVEVHGTVFRPESPCTFGRAGDLVLDEDNLYLHRLLGCFQREGDGWWLHNIGDVLPLSLCTIDGVTVELAAGTTVRLPGRQGTIRVSAGGQNHEFGYWQRVVPALERFNITTSDPSTIFYSLKLTDRQRDVLVALARHRLLGRSGRIPSKTEIGRIWGIAERTVAKNLENIRWNLRERGVKFIESPEMLVEHVVINCLVTLEDLRWAAIGETDGPRPSSSRPLGGASDM